MAPVHLLVLIHGMWGNPNHLSELARVIREEREAKCDETELHLLVAQTNRDDSTYDGVDWGGERVAEEVLQEVRNLTQRGKTVSRFSVTGYSLGGLLARYVIGVLHQRNFFHDVTPVNFNTFATPHIGLPRYPSLFSSLASSLGPRLLSRTGEQFYCVDKWSNTGRPLLEVMADPDRIFWQAMALFSHIRIYANAVNDVTVPCITASINTSDPFMHHQTNGIEIELDEVYSPLIKSYTVPPDPPAPTPKPVILSLRWFKSLKPERPVLPPLLQFSFPFNVILYFFLPVLIPSFISLALVRVSLAARSSRARIKLLENDESSSDKLINVLAQLDRRVEEAIADMVDDPHPTDASADSQQGLGEPAPMDQSVLTPTQLKIVASLNRIPDLKKEYAFIRSVRNSHAIIVCRDVKRFPGHKVGEGVVRHWSHSFVM